MINADPWVFSYGQVGHLYQLSTIQGSENILETEQQLMVGKLWNADSGHDMAIVYITFKHEVTYIHNMYPSQARQMPA